MNSGTKDFLAQVVRIYKPTMDKLKKTLGSINSELATLRYQLSKEANPTKKAQLRLQITDLEFKINSIEQLISRERVPFGKPVSLVFEVAD